VGINNKVWIGDAVTKASNLSALGNRNYLNSIVLSSLTYDNIIDLLVEKNGEYVKTLFHKRTDNSYNAYYDCDIIMSAFNNWIDEGMKEY